MNVNDPRVKRTLDLLIKSFQELLEEKHNVYSISVQEIAKRATLNRATFYAHFEDRYAFLEYWMRIKFQKILETQLQNASISNISGLKTVMLSVFDFLDKFRRYMTPTDGQFEPLFEASMQKELHHLLFKRLVKCLVQTSRVNCWMLQLSALVGVYLDQQRSGVVILTIAQRNQWY